MHHSSRACGTVLSLQTSLSLTRNMNVTVAKELYYIFSKILNFDSGNFSLTLSIHTGKCIRRFAGIYAYCRCFIDQKW